MATKLTDKQKTAVVVLRSEGKSFAEIARTVRSNRETVRKHYKEKCGDGVGSVATVRDNMRSFNPTTQGKTPMIIPQEGSVKAAHRNRPGDWKWALLTAAVIFVVGVAVGYIARG